MTATEFRRPDPGTPPENVLIEVLISMLDAAMPHLREILRGTLRGTEQQAVCQAVNGRGLLVTLTLTALDQSQTTAALAGPAEEGHA